MKKAILYFGIALLFSLSSIAVLASDGESQGHEEKEFNVSEMIMHHVKDAHEWHLWGPEHGGTTIYLPVILITEDGIKTFSSSHFYEGELIHDNENHYIKGAGAAEGFGMFHEKIYELDRHGKLHFENGHVHGNLKPYDFSITKNVLFIFIDAAIMLLVFFAVARGYKKNVGKAPKGVQSLFEPVIIYIRDEVVKPSIGEKYQKYLPYLLTLFFFIWFGNLLGLIPGAANMTGNIAVTAVLALGTFFMTNFSGKKAYWSHIFWTPGVPWWLRPIILPVELILSLIHI